MTDHDTQATSADLTLKAHAIHGLFHLDVDPGPTEDVENSLRTRAGQAEAMRSSALPQSLQWVNPQSNLKQPLWERTSGTGLALDDFYPYMRQILGAHPDGAPVCVTLTLTSDGSQVLSQVQGGDPRVWRIPLGKAAEKRCGRKFIDLLVDKARLFLFRTGAIILDLSWHYVNDRGDVLPATVVLEGNYRLSHDDRSRAKKEVPPEQSKDPPPLDADGLLKIARALLPGEWKPQERLQQGRRLLYSLAQIQGPAEQDAIRHLAIWLGHRQTTDYLPTRTSTEAGVLQPFPYLCHAIAAEGAASVIATDPMASDFVNNFVSGPGANTYAPIYIASLHSHLWLLAQTEWLPAKRQRGKHHEVHDLEEVYERMVEFRRYFYFPMVSQISLHNTFYQRSQDVFKIAERQRFLEQTTHDIAELLKARRTKWIGLISGAVAGFLVSHELLDIVSQSGLPGSMPNLRVWFAETAHASPTVIEPLVQLVERWDLIVFFGSLAGAFLGYWAAWFFDKAPKAE